MAKKIKSQNAGVTERADSKHQLSGKDLDQYRAQMMMLFRSTQLPAVVYKGKTIPRRVLTDFSYLTS